MSDALQLTRVARRSGRKRQPSSVWLLLNVLTAGPAQLSFAALSFRQDAILLEDAGQLEYLGRSLHQALRVASIQALHDSCIGFCLEAPHFCWVHEESIFAVVEPLNV